MKKSVHTDIREEINTDNFTNVVLKYSASKSTFPEKELLLEGIHIRGLSRSIASKFRSVFPKLETMNIINCKLTEVDRDVAMDELFIGCHDGIMEGCILYYKQEIS